MAIERNDPHLSEFNRVFPGFGGGMRELRYVVAMIGIKSDTYQNSQNEIKRQIAIHLPWNHDVDMLANIKNFLVGSKVNIDVFTFMNDSRSQKFLIEREANILWEVIRGDKQIAAPLSSLPFKENEKFIFLIDFWAANLSFKEEYIQNVKSIFYKIASDMKYLAWFDGDLDKVVAANDYFKKNNINNWEWFFDSEDIRIYFYVNHLNKDYLKNIYRDIQTLYNNRKSRRSINTKQCNFSLSTSADNNILKIAKENGLTRSAVVDIFFKDIKKIRNFYIGKISPDELAHSTEELTVPAPQAEMLTTQNDVVTQLDASHAPSGACDNFEKNDMANSIDEINAKSLVSCSPLNKPTIIVNISNFIDD